MKMSTYATVNGRPVQASPMLVAAIVSGAFLLFGALFAVMGLVFANTNRQLESRCTESVQAEVIRYKYSSDGLATPVYEYEFNGKTHSYSANSYSNDPAYAVGDIADIKINPEDPQEVFVPGDSTMGFISNIFILVGSISFGVALIVFIVFWAASRSAKKEQRKEEPWEM